MITASRSSPSLSDVRSVESRSGSMGKTATPVYTDVVFAAACASAAEPCGNERTDIGDADPNANQTIGKSLGDFDLIQIARLPIVHRRPEQRAQVARTRRERNVVEPRDLAHDFGGKARARSRSAA